jgi:hypothetical protein
VTGVGGRAHANDERHAAVVGAWFERVAKGLPAEALVDATEVAFDAIWRRALQVLGEITLMAIGERVVLHAADEVPLLAALQIEPKGLDAHALRERAAAVGREQLTHGLCGLLVELLAVLERLTAGVLTRPLHDAIARLGSDGSGSEPQYGRARGKALRLRVRKKT